MATPINKTENIWKVLETKVLKDRLKWLSEYSWVTIDVERYYPHVAESKCALSK